jgi:uncharacterized protein DUF6992
VDVWDRETSLARTTVAWGSASTVAGLAVAAARRDSFWRSFGLQTAGWGAVDLAVAVVGRRLQERRMRNLPDPYAPEAQEHERQKLRKVLIVNVVADVGYVVLGAVLARHDRPEVAGSGVAIIVQGGFLLVHDSLHAVGARA